MPEGNLPNSEFKTEAARDERERVLQDVRQTRDNLGAYANGILPPSHSSDLLPPSVQQIIRSDWEKRADNLPEEQRKNVDQTNAAHDETERWDRFLSQQSDLDARYLRLKGKVDDARKTRSGYAASEATPQNKAGWTAEVTRTEQELNDFIVTNIPEAMWGDYGLSSGLIAENKHLLNEDFSEKQEEWREFALDQHTGPRNIAKEATQLAGEATEKMLELQRQRDAAREDAQRLREQAARGELPEIVAAKQRVTELEQQLADQKAAEEDRKRQIVADYQKQVRELEKKVQASQAWREKMQRPPATPEEWEKMPSWIKTIYDLEQKQEKRNRDLEEENARLRAGAQAEGQPTPGEINVTEEETAEPSQNWRERTVTWFRGNRERWLGRLGGFASVEAAGAFLVYGLNLPPETAIFGRTIWGILSGAGAGIISERLSGREKLQQAVLGYSEGSLATAAAHLALNALNQLDADIASILRRMWTPHQPTPGPGPGGLGGTPGPEKPPSPGGPGPGGTIEIGPKGVAQAIHDRLGGDVRESYALCKQFIKDNYSSLHDWVSVHNPTALPDLEWANSDPNLRATDTTEGFQKVMRAIRNVPKGPFNMPVVK